MSSHALAVILQVDDVDGDGPAASVGEKVLSESMDTFSSL